MYVQRLHSSRCCAFSLSFPYPSSIIQSMSFCLGLLLLLFPSIFPSIISLCRELLPLRMCLIQFFCLILIISIKYLFLNPQLRPLNTPMCGGIICPRFHALVGQHPWESELQCL